MNVKILDRIISIVVLANVNRKVCSPFWLHKNSMISDEEMKSINDDSVSINDTNVNFKTSSFELLCDQNRIQLQSYDIEQSSRLVALVNDILRSSQARVSAMGINAAERFSFSGMKDFINFCHHCAPLNGIAPLAEDALLLDLTLMDMRGNKKEAGTMRNYNINRLPDSKDNTPMVRISVNNHQQVGGNLDLMKDCLTKAEDEHLSFFKKCDEFILGIK